MFEKSAGSKSVSSAPRPESTTYLVTISIVRVSTSMFSASAVFIVNTISPLAFAIILLSLMVVLPTRIVGIVGGLLAICASATV